MPAAHRLDGPPKTAAAEGAHYQDAFVALADAVDIFGCDPLLGHLAKCWRKLTQARTVTLAVQFGPERCFRTLSVDAAGVVTCANWRPPEDADLITSLIESVRPERRETAPRVRSSEIVGKLIVPPADSHPIGGVVLVGATPLPVELDRLFSNATASLLARALGQEHLLRDAKLESLAEFAAGAGHEINNPLAAISGRAQLLLQNETDPQRRRHLTTIGAQALRIRDMIGDTMLFARPPAPEPQHLCLSDVLDSVLDKFAAEFTSRGLTLRREYDSELPIWADETQLCVVVSELVRNAMEASLAGGIVTVEVRCETASGGDWIALAVRDEGSGLTTEAAEHLFDPFYSGLQAGRGLGFGLSKCWRIVTHHGGRIDVLDRLETGFGLLVHWPTREVSSQPS